MTNLLEFVSEPWPWYVSGPLIALIMFFLLLFGQRFGLSSNFKTMCSMVGGGKNCDYFDFDWKKDKWNLVFVLGAIIGGFISHFYLGAEEPIALNPTTVSELNSLGIKNAGESYLPAEIFSWDALLSVKGFIMVILGGFLVGFGTRYADGCTSGHAISGLSNFQKSSFVAVIGFFIGGLTITYFVLPYLLPL